MPNDLPIIRASYLTSYQDCPRRVAARLWAAVVEAAGYSDIRKTKQSIGAATGTGVHAGAQSILEEKIKTGQLGPIDTATDIAIETMHKEIEFPIIWDDETPNRNQAEQVVVRQVRQYRAEVAPAIDPIALEKRFEAEYQGVILSGQMDVIETLGARDTKSGRICRNNMAQYGAYSLLLKAHGYRMTTFFEDFVKRVRTGKDPAPAVSIPYDPATCELVAERVVARVVRDLREFEETLDPGAFTANPHSMLCGENYCPAFGTSWCIEHKQET